MEFFRTSTNHTVILSHAFSGTACTVKTRYNEILGTKKFCLLPYIRYFVISVVN